MSDHPTGAAPGKPQTHWLYVYYRRPEPQADQVVEAAGKLFEGVLSAWAASPLAAKTGSADDIGGNDFLAPPRLLRRPELRDGDITFMEIYGPLTQAGLERLRTCLDRELPRHPVLAAAARHAEHFITLPCA